MLCSPLLLIVQQLLVLCLLPSTSGHLLYVMSVVTGIAGFTLLFIEKESIFTLVSLLNMVLSRVPCKNVH